MNILTKSNKISKILLSSVLAGSMVLSISPVTFASATTKAVKTTKPVTKSTVKVVVPIIKSINVNANILDANDKVSSTKNFNINTLTYNGKSYIQLDNNLANLLNGFGIRFNTNGNGFAFTQAFSSDVKDIFSKYNDLKKYMDDQVKSVKEAQEQVKNIQKDNKSYVDLLKKYQAKYGDLDQ